MRKQVFYLFMTVMAAWLTACSPESPYNTEKVHVQVEVKQLSAGFCEVQCTPVNEKEKKVKDAYYYVDMIPVTSNVNLREIQYNFMSLLMDSVYREYINWRHDVLMTMTPFVADFASHSLYYDEMSATFTFLKPNTEYWLVAFIVDPTNNQPVGDMTYMKVRTKGSSNIAVDFSLRVNGRWTYYYPYDHENGQVLSNFPYLAATVDSAELVERLGGDTVNWKPGKFFLDSLERVTQREDYRNTPVLYGISPICNDGGDGRPEFKEGHTYYTAMAGFDGGMTTNQRAIYRYRWEGPDTKFVYNLADDAISGMTW